MPSMKPLLAMSLLLPWVFAVEGCHSLEQDAHSPARVDTTQSTDTSTNPSSLVRALYDGDAAFWPEDAAHRSSMLSERLSAAFEASQRTFGQHFLTFDPIVNGQDALIEGLVVHAAVFDGDRAYVNVRFRNFDQDNALVYSFVEEEGGWKLDEIASIGGDARWLLTDVLQNP